MADPQVEQGGLISLVDFDSGGNALVEQGALLALVSFTPPEVNTPVQQGAMIALVRRYKILGFSELGPSTPINQTAPFNETPYVWRS